MFYYLEGNITHTEPGLAVVDTGGVGYACNTSLGTLARLKKGERARLYTYVYIREDAFDIYGFFSPEELSCFKMLLSISGVGPKAALSILSAATPEQVALAVITGDEKTFTAAQGIGKKIAQRIILELGDKLKKEQLEAAGSAGYIPIAAGAAAEAETALAVLGYSRPEIAQALKGIDPTGMKTEDIVKLALKRLVRL